MIGTALWSFVVAGIAGLAWSILDDRERYRMLKYVYVSPSDFLVILLGRGVARVGVGAMGALITLAFGVLLLGVPFDPGAVYWPLLVVVMVLGLVSIVALGVLLAAICLQTRQESWHYPEAVAGALFLVSGAVFPLSVLPEPVQALGLVTPAHLVDRGRPARALPGRHVRHRRARKPVDSVTGTAAPDAATIVVALLVTGALVTLAATGVFRSASAARRIAGCWTRRPAPDGGSTRMRIYEGSPRQDFEEVFRSIGAFIDQRGMRDVLLVEAPDGFIVQGLVISGTTPAPGRDTMGTLSRRP